MRALLVSHVLPGDARPSSVRVARLLRLLPAHGVETRLLALRFSRTKRAAGERGEPPANATVVPTRTRDVPSLWRSAFEPDGGFARIMHTDPSMARAEREGGRIVDSFRPDVVVATTPSARNVELGYRISLGSALPLVIDWQDPGVLRPLRTWPSRAFYEASLERETLWAEHASLNVTTAPSYAALLAERFPAEPAVTITNGFDPVDARADDGAEKGTLVYSGSVGDAVYGFSDAFPPDGGRGMLRGLSGGRLDHVPFAREVDYRPWGLRALDAIGRNSGLISSLVFLGGKMSRAVRERFRRAVPRERTSVLPWISPEELVGRLARAHVLWLCLGGTDPVRGEPVVASKVFAYLASGRPIFAALPPECDTAKMLRGRPGVFMADPGDERGLAEALGAALACPRETGFEREEEEYRWDGLVAKFARALGKATGIS